MPHSFDLRVALLGCPSHPAADWSPASLARLRELGFNAIQLNIAWGARPGDEALNLEDVVTPPQAAVLNRDITSRAMPERLAERADDLRRRARLAKQAGLRTIFHFGAPFIGMYTLPIAEWTAQLPHCLGDGRTQGFYVALLRAFAAAHPDVDDLWLYTFDQDAWICSEFGTCPRCRGVPLHERLPAFVDLLAATWRACRPEGRTWWEPWELSAGQVRHCVDRLTVGPVGLALHSNIAEVQATQPVDRWLMNTGDQARQRGIPVVLEHWLGGASEELEPLVHLAHPQVVWRALQRLRRVPGAVGIKEYYGLLPMRTDPNLAATGLFLAEPDLDEDAAMRRLAQGLGDDPAGLVAFWELCSRGMEAFPWDTSWFTREIGRARPDHALSAARIRGFCADSPSWRSTRGAIFMCIETRDNHPWLLEDVQLRCVSAAQLWGEAIAAGQRLLPGIVPTWRDGFARGLADLAHCQRVGLSYAYHCRATNLATLLRAGPDPRLERELAAVLAASAANAPGEEIAEAQRDFAADPQAFLRTWLLPPTKPSGRGPFTMTSAS